MTEAALDKSKSIVSALLFLGAAMSMALFNLMAFLAILLAGIELWQKRKNIKFSWNPLVIGLVLLCLAFTLAEFANSDPKDFPLHWALTLRGLWRVYFILLWVYYCFPLGALKSSLAFFFVGLFANALLGIWQYYNAGWPLFTKDFWGFGPHNLHPNSVTGIVRYEAWGTAGFHLFYAEALLSGLFPLLSVLLYPYWNRQKQDIRISIALWLGLPILLLGLLFSYARSAWLAAAIGVPVFFLGILVYNFHRWRLHWKKVVMGLALLVLLVSTGLYNWSQEHSEDQNTLQGRFWSSFSTTDNQDRLLMWQAGIAILKNHFLFGLGRNNVEPLAAQYDKITAETGHTFINKASIGVHNFYIQAWLDYGALGLVALLFLWFWPVFSTLKALWQNTQSEKWQSFYLEWSLSSSLLAMAVLSAFEYAPFVGQTKNLFWLFVGLVYVLQRRLPCADC